MHWTLLFVTHQSLFIYVIYKNFEKGQHSVLDIIVEVMVIVRFISNMHVNHVIYFGKENFFANGVFNQ